MDSKSKRDEWSECLVLSLLQIYESKWLLRNRAKLKGSDWEEISHQISTQLSPSNAHKTPSQCKNKIESMKKRYRAEAENPNSCSSWQFFSRMDSLLRGGRKSNDEMKESRGSDSGERISKKRRGVRNEMVESMKLLADSMLKIEEGRMEMFKDFEKMRAAADVKKWEMELKRTEIVSKTQLQIAKMVMKRLCGKRNGELGDSLKTELDMLSRREVMGD